MLQARVLLCLSLTAIHVLAQATGGSSGGASNNLFKCYQGNPWWTYMNDTSGDACHIALEMRGKSGLGSTPSQAATSILTHAENAQLCLSAVYDMYGACLACMESSPPPTSMIPSWSQWCNLTTGRTDPVITQDIEELAPAWTQKVNFTGGTWDLKTVQAAASPSAGVLAPPTATASDLGGARPTTSTPPSSTSSHKSSNIGPIVGGVIGALAVISIAAAAFFLYLRRQRSRRVAPSSEFTRYIQPGGTHMSTRGETALSGSRGTIPRQDSATIPLTAGEDEVLEAPPAFTPGQYTGPVFEKDGYRADPNAPLFSSANAQSSHLHNPSQEPSGSAGLGA